MIHCAVIGATGYTGRELVKILLRHPHVKITALTTSQKKKIPLEHVLPALPPSVSLEIKPFSFPEAKKQSDVVFLCLPHTEAMRVGKNFFRAGKIVIDLSADFRLRDARAYPVWYGVRHRSPELLSKAVYGLPELYREEIQRAQLIANPGCYPTGAILGIAPLLKCGLVHPDPIVIDAKSGVSGAGKKLNPATQFCEVDQNFYAYKIGVHQHTPEIEQALTEAANTPVRITFVPHLLPVDRGILSTIYLRRRKAVKAQEIREAFQTFCEAAAFVRLKEEGMFPALQDVVRTNYCDVGVWSDPKSDRVIVVTAIDNLVKGASGQAVQNMNVRCGFSEEEGLLSW